jgi:hypothetical protein
MCRNLRYFVWLAASVAGMLFGGTAFASTIVDNFNSGQPQAVNTQWAGITDIGWYYTPSVSYTLTGIETIFTQSTGTGDTDRVVTFDVYTNTPAAGGTLLGGGTASSGPRGTYVGPNFTGINLVGGTTYFIGLSDISDLGVNEVSYSTAGGNAGPAGSVALGSTWVDSDGLAQFGTEASNGTTWFDKPVIEFLTTEVQPTPEPSTLMLFGSGLLGLPYLWRRKRSAR